MFKFLPRTVAQLTINTRSQARHVQKVFKASGIVASGSDKKRLSGWSVDVNPVVKSRSKRVNIAVIGGLVRC